MPRIIAALVRHGDYHQLKNTPSAWQPFALNKEGEKHAAAAATDIYHVLVKHKLVLEPACDSSQLLRAWQTSKIITGYLAEQNSLHAGLTINCYDQLAERGVGSVANLSISTIEDIVKNDPRYQDLPDNWKSDSHFCLPFQGAESLLDSGERVAQHIQAAMFNMRDNFNSTEDKLKMFVGHGAAFRHAAYHLGILEFEQIAKLSMYHHQPVYIELLDNNTWAHILGNWKVRGRKTAYTD